MKSVKEEPMETRSRNLEEIGLPGHEGSAETLMQLVPIVGLLSNLMKGADIHDRVQNPELLHNTAGSSLETNFQREGPSDKFSKEADVQMLSSGGMAGTDGDEKDPAEIPDDIREYVEMTHKKIQESRPDENWRIKPSEKNNSIAPYKRDEEDADGKEVPNFASGGGFDDDGGVMGPNQALQDIAEAGGMAPGMPPVAPAEPEAPTEEGPGPNEPEIGTPATVAPKAPAAAPALTDQDFMDRANNMLGLNPGQQAGFMKLLGDNAQKGQIGAGIAGIGDAIASGGTLGKVNPGALARSEETIRGKTREGIEGMQTIRGNQEKAQELSDKLESRDPQSPLSKWAQKAYGPVGKKIGLNLNNASAALIGDVTGKGVEALNTEFQGQLKQMGLELQKKQVEATIGNQKAERDIAREGHQAEAAKTLADRGIMKTLANAIPGTSGHKATQILEKQAMGAAAPPYGQETTRNGKTYEWSPETGKYHLKQ